LDRFLSEVRQRWAERPFVWTESGERRVPSLPKSGVVLALAPHPDDPESGAVICRLLRAAGCEIRYAVVCVSPSGVEDDYARARPGEDGVSSDQRKYEIRVQEQRRAAAEFGLGPEALTFLGLDREDVGKPGSEGRIEQHLREARPDVVMLPTGHDANRTHRWVYEAFRKAAPALVRESGRPLCALYNEDPKTERFAPDLYVVFGEERAAWKRRLLRLHDSQQARNVSARGRGFDERILDVNRRGRQRLADSMELGALAAADGHDFAECFELELFPPL
jgi:LmbE family N-acetylglucosaminyl deacetylase